LQNCPGKLRTATLCCPGERDGRHGAGHAELRDAATTPQEPEGKHMNMRARGRRSTALAGGLGVVLLLAGCGASETSGGGGGGTTEASDLSIDCAPYE
jgi:hypothetical protein